ncbi:MAG TPA: hypothetical protein VGB95_03940, partial [Chitinophagales bacterium]
MKNLFSLFLITMFSCQSASVFAQETLTASTSSATTKTGKQKFAPKSFIEVASGIAIPLGNYAKTNYSNPKAGFAGVGPTVAISNITYIKKSNWGIASSLSYSQYFPKGLSNLASGFQNDFDIDSTRVHSGKYQSVQLLLGPAYSYSFGMVTLDFYAMGGFNNMFSPRVNVLLNDGGTSFTNGGTDYSFWQKQSFAMAVALQFGAGVRVEPVKHFGIS